jgi:hypothetical protein
MLAHARPVSTGPEGKHTDDVAGAALPGTDGTDDVEDEAHALAESPEPQPDPDALGDPPPEIGELAAACVRFVEARYGVPLDYRPDTLSLLDQWMRDARAESERRAEILDLVESAAGAYLGEVIRRERGAQWRVGREPADYRLFLSTVYLAFNPLGMVREALLLEPAEGWHAHFELDPAEAEAVEARLAALPAAEDDEYYAPSTRYDVLCIVFDALRESMRSRGLSDVRFSPEDYESR